MNYCTAILTFLYAQFFYLFHALLVLGQGTLRNFFIFAISFSIGSPETPFSSEKSFSVRILPELKNLMVKTRPFSYNGPRIFKNQDLTPLVSSHNIYYLCLKIIVNGHPRHLSLFFPMQKQPINVVIRGTALRKGHEASSFWNRFAPSA